VRFLCGSCMKLVAIGRQDQGILRVLFYPKHDQAHRQLPFIQ